MVVAAIPACGNQISHHLDHKPAPCSKCSDPAALYSATGGAYARPYQSSARGCRHSRDPYCSGSPDTVRRLCGNRVGTCGASRGAGVDSRKLCAGRTRVSCRGNGTQNAWNCDWCDVYGVSRCWNCRSSICFRDYAHAGLGMGVYPFWYRAWNLSHWRSCLRGRTYTRV